MNICITGAGSAIAASLIPHCLALPATVFGVYHRKYPAVRFRPEVSHYLDASLYLCRGISDIPLSVEFDSLITLQGAIANSKLTKMTNEDWDNVLDANLSSVFRTLRSLLPRVKPMGNVVIVGSIIGSIGGFGCSNYAAAKAGLAGMVRAVANEVADKGICVNLLELGYVSVGMGERLSDNVKENALRTIPLKRFANPSEVVHAIEFLRTTHYMTGNTLTLAGGLR